MLKPITIIKAWYQVLKKFTTNEHKRRAKICDTCPESKYKKYIDFVDDELKEVKGFVCGQCGCALIAKIRSTDVCVKWQDNE